MTARQPLIVDHWFRAGPVNPDGTDGYSSGLEYAVRCAAAEYADHREYREDFTPYDSNEETTP